MAGAGGERPAPLLVVILRVFGDRALMVAELARRAASDTI